MEKSNLAQLIRGDRSVTSTAVQAEMETMSRMASATIDTAPTLSSKEKARAALKLIKTQPGRPSKEAMIRQLMEANGMTRTQAKIKIKEFDNYMLEQFEKMQTHQQEQEALISHVQPDQVKPFEKSIARSLGYTL